MFLSTWWARLIRGLPKNNDRAAAPDRYHILRRNIIILMLLVTIVPLTFMAVINHYQYQTNLKSEIISPIQTMVSKTKHSFELFLEERLSTVRFIASAYSYEELSDGQTLNRIFRTLKSEFSGFVDLGLIDKNGIQISYAGPYARFLGKDYSRQSWFQEVAIRGAYISDVFLGYRKFPHIAIAVQNMRKEGKSWILRATIDTHMFDNLIASMGLGPQSDAFLINKESILQTNSKFYGKILEPCPLKILRGASVINVLEQTDHLGKEIIMAYAHINNPDYTLVVIKPRSVILKTWFTLKSEMFFIYIISVIIIILVVLKLSGRLVKSIREADERRESAFRELEHSQKLSSIGRLAAGVAHEINNPLAIINEKAGLIKDVVEHIDDCNTVREKFLDLASSILKTVDRCRTITHRLLGFARRLETLYEELNLNDVITEVFGFLEKEALYRQINIQFNLAEDLPKIYSDRSQLQQVFLNILNNAFAAVDDGGQVTISTWEENPSTLGVTIQDNGCGMSEETLRHMFEPFFTTKKEYGTGLGLPITYGIVKKLGGDFKVRSKEGEGSNFTIFFPKNPK